MLLFFILFVCALAQGHTVWFGSLELHLMSDGGTFIMKGYTDQDTWVPIPGEHGTWPYSVQDQEENLLVVDRDGIPHAQLKRGEHQITGIFSWSETPDHIKTPTNIGIISATSNNQTVPVYRTPKRVWLSTESLPEQTHSVQQLQHDEHIVYTIISQGVEQPVRIPVSLSPDQKILAIETSIPYWYRNNILHTRLPQGTHTAKVILHTDIKRASTTPKSLTLNRVIQAEPNTLTITDMWNGDREENILLYANTTQHLPKGHQSTSIIHSQPHTSPIAPLMTQKNIEDYAVRIQHPGHIRAFEQWPLASTSLWILCALMLWKNERFKKRRLLLFSALLCVFLSPAALIFCICWVASKGSFSSKSDDSAQIRALAIFGIFAALVMLAISPTTVHTINVNQISPDLYWMDSATIFVFATVSMAIFAFVAYKNIQVSIVVAICIGLAPNTSFAQTGFPLCSIQLEGESIIISGEVHQSQEGEWKAPGPIGSIHVQQIIVDGRDFHSFRTTNDQYVSLFLPQGISEFEIHGTYNTPFGLQFPQQPARLDFFSSTHQIEGLNEDHSPRNTLYFWDETSPDIIVPTPTLVMQVHLGPTQTSVHSTITNHIGTRIYDLPIWSDQSQELATSSNQQVFPSQDSQKWTDVFPTPSNISFVPSSDQYNIKAYIQCSEDLLCTHKDVIWNHSDILLPSQTIDIRPAARRTQKTRILTRSDHPTSFISVWHPPKDILGSVYIIDHNPRTVFLRLHIPYLGLSFLICFSCAFILAKHARSPLNIMEWLWILLGAGFVHPLAVPLCILGFLTIHNVWIKYLCLLALGCVSFTTTFGMASWKANELVAAIDEDFVYQGLGIWLLGVFFFIHSFKLSQKTMEIGRSQTR